MSIGPGNDMAPNRRQAITRTTADLFRMSFYKRYLPIHIYIPMSYMDTINYPSPNTDVGIANIW